MNALSRAHVVHAPSEPAPARLLSSSRIQVVLVLFVAMLLATLTTLTVGVVGHIFSTLTPSIERDLTRKAELGAVKVANEMDLALLVSDKDALTQAFNELRSDPDVSYVIARDASGLVLAAAGHTEHPPAELFAARPGKSRRVGEDIVAWAEASVEGAPAGSVAAIVSTHRLQAGERLRRRILIVAGLGALGGLLLSLVFVRVYVLPLKRVIRDAFDRLARAGMELAAKERLERELEIGARIQTCILPHQMGGEELEIAGCMKPADEVGGDYYDAFDAAGSSWVAIGDVAGHGLPSGLVMLMTQSAIGALARELPQARPSELLSAVNRLLFDNVRNRLGNDEHVTLSLFKHEGKGRFCFAGAHEEILVWRKATRQIELIPTPGPWLGIVPDISKSLTDEMLLLEEGDMMVLYTDGVTEARNHAHEQFGLERLMEVVHRHYAQPAQALCESIFQAVAAWSEKADDDVTVLVVRRTELPRAA